MTVTSAGNNSQFQINLLNDFSTIKSYSVYKNHAVAIANDGTPMAIGDNTNWPIYKKLPQYINKWTMFCVQDSNRHTYQVESAVCGVDYTLYLLDQSLIDENMCPLAYVKKGRNNGFPNFISTNGSKIYAIYGGSFISAAISTDGIIHIIDNSIFSNNFCTRQAYLPLSNFPIQLAFQDDYVIALSSIGNVYELGPYEHEFDFINNLPPCSFISGTSKHCILVSNDGDVFVRGLNKYDQLGLGQNTIDCDEFKQVNGLRNQNIKEAYAGSFHSLFVNSNGKILGCGSNEFGELFKNASNNNVVQPAGTSINSGASFCIAGFKISIAFINCNPPSKSPNQILRPFNNLPFHLMFVDVDSLQREVNDLRTRNNDLFFEKSRQDGEIMALKNENLMLKSRSDLMQQQREIEILKTENDNLKMMKTTNMQQQKTINSQKIEIERLKEENNGIKKMKSINMQQQATIDSQKDEIKRLKEEIENLMLKSRSDLMQQQREIEILKTENDNLKMMKTTNMQQQETINSHSQISGIELFLFYKYFI